MESLIEQRENVLSKLKAAVISLSVAAIGLTMVFIKDIIGKDNGCALMLVKGAWVLWAISIAATVLSYFADHQGLSYQVKGEVENVNYTNTNFWYSVGAYLYLSGLAAFLIGLFVFVVAAIIGV